MGLSEHPNQENSVENRPAGRTPPPKDVAFLWEPPQAEAALGKTLDDRYTLEEVLHDSGMGLVFRASDREKLRQVVVKMIYIDDLDNDAESGLPSNFLSAKLAAWPRFPIRISCRSSVVPSPIPNVPTS